jgi:hypothetical protein
MSRYTPFFDNNSRAGTLADYAHADALYVRNNMRLSPKTKFLYHVVIDVNQSAIASLGYTVQNLLNKREFNLLVETVDLPTFSVDVDEKNQYNRKKLVQTRVRYEPVQLVFHDDMAGLTTLLWEAYFRYYYQDPNYASKNSRGQPNTTVPQAYYHSMYRGEDANKYRYGLDNNRSNSTPFFNSISVYQLYSNNARPEHTAFTLINPMISNMSHDTMSQSETGLTKNTMRINYEAVIYGRGRTAVDEPAGFADPAHYDLSYGTFSNKPNNIGDLFTIGGLVNGISTVWNDVRNGQVDSNTILAGIGILQNLQNINTNKPSTNIATANTVTQNSGFVLPKDPFPNSITSTVPVRTR